MTIPMGQRPDKPSKHLNWKATSKATKGHYRPPQTEATAANKTHKHTQSKLPIPHKAESSLFGPVQPGTGKKRTTQKLLLYQWHNSDTADVINLVSNSPQQSPITIVTSSSPKDFVTQKSPK